MFVAPLETSERDQFCAEAAETGLALGIPERLLPATYAGVQASLQRRYSTGEIVVGDDARELASSLLVPPLGPATLLFRPARIVTIGLLPDGIRSEYAFRWTNGHTRSFRRLVRVIRTARRLLPPVVREWRVSRVQPMH
jgi:uncharacterized protein (DUF2236 family)